ncbi:MAG TPA: GGDEF domain-containing protein, partial [Lysobacter sp.]
RPAVVLVAFGIDEALAAWRHTAATYLAGSLVFLLLITALGLRLLHELRQRESHQSRIDQLNRTRAILSGATSMIMRAGTRSELFEGACRVAVRLGQFDVAWVDVFDAETGRPMPVASAGADAAFILQGDPQDEHASSTLATGQAAEAYRRHETVASNSLAARDDHSPRRARALRRGYRAAITLPLIHGNDVVAALTLLARPEGFFDADETRLLEDLADDLSHALEHLASLERIEYLALYDVLTGLPNRALFVDRTLHALQDATDAGVQCALVKLDIERFRQINGTIGRPAGDALIALIARRLADTLGRDGLLSRPERDHFMFVVGGLGSEAEAASALQQILHACFDQPFHVEGHDLHLSARAGVAMFPSDGDHPDTLLANAEAALARAKHTGERMTFYTAKMNARAAESLQIENKLRGALERDQFVLHYQPKFDARSGALVGLEGLIRWESDGTLVPPAHFVPLLEETGLILPVGEWVMQQALRDWRHWRDLGLDPPRIAVNVSALQLRQDSFARCVHEVLESDDGHGERVLELEITESMLMTRVESNADKLDAIRSMGVHIAIDDFGTGYSSLQYIAKLPLDTLKIDRSFVTGMTHNATDREIVASVISLAHQLHLKVVAEGVDSHEQAELLRELDCDEMQGYLFSPPLPPEQIQALMRQRQRPRGRAALLH